MDAKEGSSSSISVNIASDSHEKDTKTKKLNSNTEIDFSIIKPPLHGIERKRFKSHTVRHENGKFKKIYEHTKPKKKKVEITDSKVSKRKIVKLKDKKSIQKSNNTEPCDKDSKSTSKLKSKAKQINVNLKSKDSKTKNIPKVNSNQIANDKNTDVTKKNLQLQFLHAGIKNGKQNKIIKNHSNTQLNKNKKLKVKKVKHKTSTQINPSESLKHKTCNTPSPSPPKSKIILNLEKVIDSVASFECSNTSKSPNNKRKQNLSDIVRKEYVPPKKAKIINKPSVPILPKHDMTIKERPIYPKIQNTPNIPFASLPNSRSNIAVMPKLQFIPILGSNLVQIAPNQCVNITPSPLIRVLQTGNSIPSHSNTIPTTASSTPSKIIIKVPSSNSGLIKAPTVLLTNKINDKGMRIIHTIPSSSNAGTLVKVSGNISPVKVLPIPVISYNKSEVPSRTPVSSKNKPEELKTDQSNDKTIILDHNTTNPTHLYEEGNKNNVELQMNKTSSLEEQVKFYKNFENFFNVLEGEKKLNAKRVIFISENKELKYRKELVERYQCIYCSKQFTTSYNTVNHIMNVHGKDKTESRTKFTLIKTEMIYCSICNAINIDLPTFKKHFLTKHNNNKVQVTKRKKVDQLKCKKCKKCFARQCDYTSHLNQFHGL